MRRLGYYISILLTSLLLLAGIIVGALTSDQVQTAIVQLATDELSHGLGVHVGIARTEYQFPARVRVYDVCIGDEQGDTLASVNQLYIQFDPWALMRHKVRFSRVDVLGATAHVYRTAPGRYNFDYLTRALAAQHNNSPGSTLLSVEDIHLQDIRLRYEDYTALIDHTDMNLYHLAADSISASLDNLSAVLLHDGYRMVVQDVAVRFVRAQEMLSLPLCRVALQGSELDVSGASYNLRTRQIQLPLRTCHIHTADLAMLVPQLRTIDGMVHIGGTWQGTPARLEAHGLTLRYNNHTLLLADGAISGLDHVEQMQLDLNCQQLEVSAPIIEQVASDYLNRPFALPVALHKLGMVRYRGCVQGALHNLTARGAVSTDCGNATIDGQLCADEHFEVLDYRLKADTRYFQLGRLLDRGDLQQLSLSLNSQGRIDHGQPDLDLDATVSDFSYRGYTYAPLRAKGHLTQNAYTGIVHIDDPNGYVHFDGHLALNAAPEADCALTLRHVRPGRLNIRDGVPDIDLSAILRARASGTDPDHMQARLSVDSILLVGGHRTLGLGRVLLTAVADGQLHKQIALTSDYLDARVNGHFAYQDLPGAVMRMAERYIPSLLTDDMQRLAHRPALAPVRADVHVDGHHVSRLMRLVGGTIPVTDNPHLALTFNEAGGQLAIEAHTDLMRMAERNWRDLTLRVDNHDGPLSLSLSGAAMGVAAHLDAAVVRDSIGAVVDFTDVSGMDRIQIPSIQTAIRLSRYLGQPAFDVRMDRTEFVVADTTYTIEPVHLAYRMADTTLTVHQLQVHTLDRHQQVDVSGIVSHRMSDMLEVSLHRIDAGTLFPLVVDEKSFKLGGQVSGSARAYGLLTQPAVEADVSIAHLTMCDEYLGNATGQLRFQPRHQSLLFEANVTDTTQVERAHLMGSVGLGNGSWMLDITPNHFPLAFINYWTSGILDDIRGHGSGQVKVSGDRSGRTYVVTRMRAEDASFVAPFVGARYHINDSIFMDSTSIRFEHCMLTDDEMHPVECTGRITHDNFRNFAFNLDITPHGALVLDLPEVTSDGLQGRVYADGHARITGDESLVDIQADIRTAKRSQFKFSIATASSAHQSNFIRFVERTDSARLRAEQDRQAVLDQQNRIWYDDPDPEDSVESSFLHDHIAHILQMHHPDSRIRVGINVEVNPLATVQLLLDNRTGDMISAQGDGALRFSYDSQTDDYSLIGSYTVQQGQLGFTLGNVIRRNFQVGPGSEIVFTGDPEEPELHVRAAYRVTASLRDLFGDEVQQLPTSRTSVPVNTWLNLSGRLSQPVISFDLELPMSEDVIQQQVRSVINTDEMLMRQVVYLLVFGRFFTPEYLANSEYTGINETYSLLSSTVTGQINSWLGKLTDAFSMGFNVRSDGEGADASQEYEAQFMLQPVDRLVINGNVGYRYNDISNRPFFGDLDVEILLTEDGLLRLKGYTHTVDKYSLRQANTIQGVGLLWRYNFNWLSPEERRTLRTARRLRRSTKKSTKE